MSSSRRYDIDWLRVIAIGLLLIYHIAIVFQPWGVLIGFMQNDKPMESLWVPMSMLNVWRIPLLFFVSGMGVCFAMRKRDWKQLIIERTRRILVPFIFGIFTIVPLHVFIWQKYYNQNFVYSPNPAHLWFLANIFIYVLVLLPVFFLLKKNKNGLINKMLKRLYSNPIGLVAITIPFVIEVLLVKPDTFELYAMTMHGFFLGLLAFFFGFTFILNGDEFWQTIMKWKWMFLGLATLMYLLRIILFHLEAPKFYSAIESNIWIYAIVGLANQYLNKPSKVLSYLKQGVYPIYILHMIFIYLGSIIILPLSITTGMKLFLIILFTFVGCFVTYDLLIRRQRLLRPLFGI